MPTSSDRCAPSSTSATDAISQSGGTPLVVATKSAGRRGGRVLGVIHLKDIVKDGLRERFAELRAMGIRTVMITGDNPLTAKAIAAEAGVDDFLAEATPEDKLALIRREQEGGNLVAMTGDGTNDAPALAQADVGVAMNTGTSAAKEAGNMVDLDSDPTKLIDIVRIGKQLLITRGALTTFSIANDIAKYFAIIPAMFMGVFPGLAVLNVMQLHSPASAVICAIIFNAIVIVAADPARPARREVPPRQRLPDPQPQPAHLRPRRRHRAVHRHQAHRPRRQPHPRLLSPEGETHMSTTRTTLRQASVALRAMLVFTVVLGVGYTLLITGIGQLAAALAGERLDRHGERRQDRGLSADRAVLHGCRRRRRCPSSSSRGPQRPATATTAAPRAAATTGPRTAT